MTMFPSDDSGMPFDDRVRERYRNLGTVEENLEKHFKSKCPFHFMETVPNHGKCYSVFIFFKTDKDLDVYKQNGFLEEIKEKFYEELELAKRQKRDEVTVDFQFDSDENIQVTCNGDYERRMH